MKSIQGIIRSLITAKDYHALSKTIKRVANTYDEFTCDAVESSLWLLSLDYIDAGKHTFEIILLIQALHKELNE